VSLERLPVINLPQCFDYSVSQTQNHLIACRLALTHTADKVAAVVSWIWREHALPLFESQEHANTTLREKGR
jgi:hypothetical protein